MPIDRSRYPREWPEISQDIRARAGNRCERCGAPNYAVMERFADGSQHIFRAHVTSAEWRAMKAEIEELAEGDDWPHYAWIVLTVAHLDQDPANNDPANLACLCQACHLGHDRPYHVAHAKLTWSRKRRETLQRAGQTALWNSAEDEGGDVRS